MSDILFILLPGTMYFWVLFVGQGPMQEVLQEKETRVLSRILACPVGPGQYVVAKLLRSFVLCGLAIVLLLGVSALALGMRWGSPLLLAAVIVAWSLSMTGIVGLIFSLARTREQASVFSPLILLTLALVGGGMFPFEDLPSFLQTVGQFTPNRWAVMALQGVARSRPVPELIQPFVGLLATGVVGILVALALFQRRLARG